MTDDQSPRRMKDMMGDLEAKTSDPKIAQDENTSKPSQLDLIIQPNSSITLFGYVGSHQELKIDYKLLSRIIQSEFEPKIEFIQACGFILMGPQVKESIPGLDKDELTIIGHKIYSVKIPDTGKGGAYSLTLTNRNLEHDRAKVRLDFSTGVWTVNPVE